MLVNIANIDKATPSFDTKYHTMQLQKQLSTKNCVELQKSIFYMHKHMCNSILELHLHRTD